VLPEVAHGVEIAPLEGVVERLIGGKQVLFVDGPNVARLRSDPMTTPTVVPMADGAPIAAYDFGGEGPPVLLAHATGFHAHAWLPVIAFLSERFHCYGFDERGHGASPTPPALDFSWVRFGSDARAVAAHFGLERPYAAGHSAGGALLLRAEEDHPGTWRAVWAYEPVVFPPAESTMDNPLAAATRKRKGWFESRQAAHANYASKRPFSEFTPEALDAYLDYGLVDDPAGGVRLACSPEDEARTYEESMRSGIWELLGAVRIPVRGVAGGASDHPPAQLLQGVVERLPDATIEVMDGLGHFGPFEDPYRIAASMAASFTAA
jgi:pimeloyl-ACP methyl ester carboxylesterase